MTHGAKSHTVHDVRAAADRIGAHSDQKARAEALFDEVWGQIKTAIAEAKQKQTVPEAVQVIEDTAVEYEKHREYIIAKIAA